MKNSVVLSLGSNSDDCKQRMDECKKWLSCILSDATCSDVYETPALNGKDKNYLNAVFVGYSEFPFDILHTRLKQYEKDCGRTALSKVTGIVPIDIDIVMWNGDILRRRDFEMSYFKIGWEQINNDCKNVL